MLLIHTSYGQLLVVVNIFSMWPPSVKILLHHQCMELSKILFLFLQCITEHMQLVLQYIYLQCLSGHCSDVQLNHHQKLPMKQVSFPLFHTRTTLLHCSWHLPTLKIENTFYLDVGGNDNFSYMVKYFMRFIIYQGRRK